MVLLELIEELQWQTNGREKIKGDNRRRKIAGERRRKNKKLGSVKKYRGREKGNEGGDRNGKIAGERWNWRGRQ